MHSGTSLLISLMAAALVGGLTGVVARGLRSGQGRHGVWIVGMAILTALIAGSLAWAAMAWPVWLWLGVPSTRWPWFGAAGVQLVGVSLVVATCLTLAVACLDRMIHRSAAEALRLTGRLSLKAAWTLPVALMLWRVPAIVAQGWASLAGAVLAGVLLVALAAMVTGHAALLGVAMTLPAGARRQRWTILSVLVSMVMPLAGVIVLVMTLVTAGSAGQGVEVLLGYDPRTEPALSELGVRWVWVYACLVFTMALGVTAALRLTAFPDVEKEKAQPARPSSFHTAPTMRTAAQPDLAASKAGDDLAHHDNASGDASPADLAAMAHGPTRVLAASKATAFAIGVTSPEPASPSPHPSPSPSQHLADGAASSVEPAVDVDSGTPVSPVSAVSGASWPVDSSQAEAAAPDTLAGQSDLASLAGVFPTRLHYAVMAILAAGFVFYASLVPVNYQPLSWEQAVERFSNVRHYQLGIDRRADLVANLVVVVPVTFLAMGALQSRSRRRWQRWMTEGANAVIIAALAFAYVVAIEFTQEWFPPRTVSQNDMHAGWAGAAVGIAMWLLFGRELTASVRWVMARRGSALAVTTMLWLYTLALTVYALFPMDFTFDQATLQAKRDQGRMSWLLWETAASQGLGRTLWMIAQQMLLFLPVGLLMARLTRRGNLWRPGVAVAGGVAVAVVHELMRLPVFSAYSGSAHLGGRVLGVVLGVWVARWVFDRQGRLAPGQQWSASTRAWVGMLGGVAASVVAGIMLLYPFEFEAGAEVFRAKMSHFWNWPFQLYYYAGEWFALSKVVQCAILFSFTGMLMRWGSALRPMRGMAIMLAVVLATGLAVEIAQAATGQRVVHTLSLDQGLGMSAHEQAIDITDNTISKGMVFSIGKVSDVTDVLVYVTGALGGWLLASILLPSFSADVLSRRERSPPSLAR